MLQQETNKPSFSLAFAWALFVLIHLAAAQRAFPHHLHMFYFSNCRLDFLFERLLVDLFFDM